MKAAVKEKTLEEFESSWPYPEISAEQVYKVLQRENEADAQAAVNKAAIDGMKQQLVETYFPREQQQKAQELQAALAKAEEGLTEDAKQKSLQRIYDSFELEYNLDKTEEEKTAIVEKAKENYDIKARAALKEAKEAISALDEQGAIRTLLVTLGCRKYLRL